MAVRRINEKRVKKFLGTDGETPFFAVAYWGHFEICKLIVETGAKKRNWFMKY